MKNHTHKQMKTSSLGNKRTGLVTSFPGVSAKATDSSSCETIVSYQQPNPQPRSAVGFLLYMNVFLTVLALGLALCVIITVPGYGASPTIFLVAAFLGMTNSFRILERVA